MRKKIASIALRMRAMSKVTQIYGTINRGEEQSADQNFVLKPMKSRRRLRLLDIVVFRGMHIHQCDANMPAWSSNQV